MGRTAAPNGGGAQTEDGDVIEVPKKDPNHPAPVEPSEFKDIPYGIPVEKKKGFVSSPYAPDKGMVDVTDIPPGTKVECPLHQENFPSS